MLAIRAVQDSSTAIQFGGSGTESKTRAATEGRPRCGLLRGTNVLRERLNYTKTSVVKGDRRE